MNFEEIIENIKNFFNTIFKENTIVDGILDFIENILPSFFISVRTKATNTVKFLIKSKNIIKTIFTIIIACRTAYLIFFMKKTESIVNLNWKLVGQCVNIIFLVYSLIRNKAKN